MVVDDAARLAVAEAAIALQQRVTDNMVALQLAEKKAVEAPARVCAIALVFEEEHASTAALEAEAAVAALQLASTTAFSSAPPHPRSCLGVHGERRHLLDLRQDHR
jgi:hypothetical protein